jgi:hypothetical protein
MKALIISIQLLLFICFLTYGGSTNSNNDTISIEYHEISNIVPLDLFETMKMFIIKKGDRETYSNMYSNNPHYSFSGFESYLNPETGQRNSYCDTSLSDFNEIVIRDQNANPQYYYIHIVRKGDLEDTLIHTWEGMSEEKVYVLYQNIDRLDSITKNLTEYIDLIKYELSTSSISWSIKSSSLLVLPNPVKGNKISFQFETDSNFLLEIIDINGVVVFRQFQRNDNKNDLIEIPVNHLSQGLYVCRIGNSKKVLIGKFIKE